MAKVTAGRDELGAFAPKFAELNDDVLFGEVWSREDKLSARDRSVVTVTALMARSMHMAASYWGFVLMSVHLGMHWGMIVGMFRRLLKGRKIPAVAVWGLRLAAAAIAGYGLICFIQKDIVSYMFLKNQFVFFDFEQSAISVFAEYIAMMGFWIFVSFYMSRGIGKISGKHSKRREKINEKN